MGWTLATMTLKSLKTKRLLVVPFLNTEKRGSAGLIKDIKGKEQETYDLKKHFDEIVGRLYCRLDRNEENTR
ncbi:hypothetical protein Glove_117g572 [Diversispora epigaea]|uniref:Uncharacterized protein n=1 Tax=Diversispora epigaea TaxID=1348612 RepID=A0A397J4B1_9GLOM|nr:hypothetical protein Glove_117g572 [Diversispora epigaea]